VSNWLGGTYDPPERQALSTCLAVVRGSLTDRQLERLCRLLVVPPGAERDPQLLLAEHDHLPVARCLLELRERAWQGASVSSVVALAQAAVTLADARTGDAMATIVRAVADFEAYDPEFSLDHLLAEFTLGGSVARRRPVAASRSRHSTARRGCSGRTYTSSAWKKGGCPPSRPRQRRQSARNDGRASSESAGPSTG
jgi:hypothetical protein